MWMLFFLITITIVLVAILVLLIVVYAKREFFTVSSGIPISDLAQSESFYKDRYGDTLKYLIAVYPTAKESLSSLNSLQLASFYNSLWYYYNCDFQYHDRDLGVIPGVTGKTWDKLPCANDYPLPYCPQGILFNFWTYHKYNIPYTISDSGSDKEYLELQNIGAGRPGIAFTTYSDNNRAGPGVYWVNQRGIERHIWYPNGPVNTKGIASGNGQDSWIFNIGQKMPWKYPKGWQKGMGNNEYMEVTHFYHGPGGITTSPGYWYNGFLGTGLFLSLGKTVTGNNKIDMAMKLAKELIGGQGVQVFEKYFLSSDPYTWMYNLQTFTNCNSIPSKCAAIMPCCMGGGADTEKGIPRQAQLDITSFKDEVVRYQNDHGEVSGFPTTQGIRTAIDAAANLTDYRLSRFSVNILCDEPIFFMGVILGYDTIQMSSSANSSGYFVYEILDLRLPPQYREKIKNRDYSQTVDILYTGPTNPKVFNNPWNKQYVVDSLDYLQKQRLVTLRDPLDVHNENKVIPLSNLNSSEKICPNNAEQPESWFNLYAPQNKLSDSYKCLFIGTDSSPIPTCRFTGNNPTC